MPIKATVKLTGFDTLQTLVPRVVDALKREFYEVARATAEAQRELIGAKTTPAGGAQKDVSRKTFAIKRRMGVEPNVPLYRTGRLADPNTWRVRRVKNGATVRPPKDREAAVAILGRAGFRTVFDELPEEIKKQVDERVKRAVDQEVAR